MDNVTFQDIETSGVDKYLKQIQDELVTNTYKPTPNLKHKIPKGNGKYRTLGIPTIKDRVVQGALKLILEAVFEADFQDGSYGYRPKRNPHQAIERVAKAVVENKTRVIDIDLKAYFDTVRHDLLLEKVAERVDDDDIMRLLKLILKAGGKRGVPQGGPISPFLANLYLNEIDKMLEKAKEVTRRGKYTYIEYARFADDLIVLVDGYSRWEWLGKAAYRRLLEEFSKIGVEINQDKTRQVNLNTGETFNFLGFNFRKARTRKGKWGVQYAPKMEARNILLSKIKDIFRRFQSQPVERVVELINPILRGWVNYFRVGQSSRCFGYVKDWVEKKTRRHQMRARNLKGFGWNRWSRSWLYQKLKLYNDYKIRYYRATKALPER